MNTNTESPVIGRTIPENILAKMEAHYPQLAPWVEGVRSAHVDDAEQAERDLANRYLLLGSRLSGTQTFHLGQVSVGGPWGGDWVSTIHASILTGYDDSHFRRLVHRHVRGVKRSGVWYLSRKSLREWYARVAPGKSLAVHTEHAADGI